MKEMTQEVIPEIVKVVDERGMLAAESRHRQLKGSTIDSDRRFLLVSLAEPFVGGLDDCFHRFC